MRRTPFLANTVNRCRRRCNILKKSVVRAMDSNVAMEVRLLRCSCLAFLLMARASLFEDDNDNGDERVTASAETSG